MKRLLIFLLLLTSCEEEKIKPEDVLKFDTIEKQTQVADGVSVIPLTVIIDKNADSDKRTIRFRTRVGKFQNNDTIIDVSADAMGIAKALLKSDKASNGLVQAQSTSANITITKEVEFTAIDADKIIKFDDANIVDNKPADGVNTIELIAIIDKSSIATGEQQKVTFQTTLGEFPDAKTTFEAIVDANGIAKAYLKSSKHGKANITITYRNVSRSREVSFKKSEPEFIYLTYDSFALKAGIDQTINIKATLTTSIGKPSPGYVVTFTAVDDAGKPIGLFKNNVPSNEVGEVSVDYSVGTTSYRGKVTITATLNSLNSNAVLYIKD